MYNTEIFHDLSTPSYAENFLDHDRLTALRRRKRKRESRNQSKCERAIYRRYNEGNVLV